MNTLTKVCMIVSLCICLVFVIVAFYPCLNGTYENLDNMHRKKLDEWLCYNNAINDYEAELEETESLYKRINWAMSGRGERVAELQNEIEIIKRKITETKSMEDITQGEERYLSAQVENIERRMQICGIISGISAVAALILLMVGIRQVKRKPV